MQIASLTKRKTLIGLLVATLFANLIWIYTFQQEEEAFEFLLVPTMHALVSDAESLEIIPYYDEAKGIWIQSGMEIQTLVPLLIDSDPQNIGPDGIGKYAVIRLPKDAAAVTAYMGAIRALASEGICKVGVMNDTKLPDSDGSYEASIYEIVEIRNELGRQERCLDRVNS